MSEMRSRDADPHARPIPRAGYAGFVRTSRHLVMTDGTRIAVDVCLPRDLPSSARVPAIVRSTRYFRRFRLARALRGLVTPEMLDPLSGPLRTLFTAQGYAWIDVDARGSGASFGYRPCPWWIDGEVKDGAEIVDWIIRQPWSNGRVGSTGVSYDGTAAEFLAFHRHPAVRAIAPRFSLYDTYADIAFPGGVHLAWFTENWARANAALDRNEPHDFIGTVLSLRVTGAEDERVALPGTIPHVLARAFLQPAAQKGLKSLLGPALAGVAPVDDDRDDVLLSAAVASHARNFSVHEGALLTSFRDDVPPNSPVEGGTVDRFSPHTYLREIAASGAAFLSQSGWFDGAYPRSAIERHRALSSEKSELLVGPWVHGGLLDLDPDAPARPAAFDHGAELLRFFDRHLKDARDVEVPRVRYWRLGEGGWKTSTTFPPAEAETEILHLGAERTLKRAPSHGYDVHEVDRTAGTGRRTRWETLLSPFVHADGPRVAVTSLVYTSEPLGDDFALTGYPVLQLRVGCTPGDAAIFVYLSEVTRDGRERAISEGVLRTIHRTRIAHGRKPRVEATFLSRDAIRPGDGEVVTHAIELLPTAFLVRRGHRLRLSIAGADVDHFRAPEARSFRIEHEGSRLFLPFVRA